MGEGHFLEDLVGELGLGGKVVLEAETVDSGVDLQEVELVAVDLVNDLLDAVHESLGGAMDRVLEDLLRGAVFVDDTFVHEEDAGAYVAGEAHLVGDDEHRQSFLGELAHDAEDLSDHGRVESGGGLVEEDGLRVHGERTGDGDPLLLSARKGIGMDVGLLGHADLLQKLHGLLAGFFLGGAEQLHGGVGDIFEDGHVVEEVETLEDHAHLAAHLVERVALGCDVFALEEDLPAGGRLEHVDGAQKSALSRAGRADDADDFSLADLAVDILQDGDGAAVGIDEGLG